MPARDPAASPHMPVSLGGSATGASQSPTLPLHTARSPSSSGWSRTSVPHLDGLGQGYGSLTMSNSLYNGARDTRDREQGEGQKDGFVSNLLRRVSGDKGRPGSGNGTNAAGEDEMNAGAQPSHPGESGWSTASYPAANAGGRRVSAAVAVAMAMSGQEDTRPSTPADLLSKSHHAIRDSTNRLASLSFSRPRRRSVAHSTPDGQRSSAPTGDATPVSPPHDPRQTARSPLSSRSSSSSARDHFARDHSPTRGRRSSSSVTSDHRPLVPSHLQQSLSATVDEEDLSPSKSLSNGNSNSRSGLSMMIERENERRARSASSDEDLKIQGSPGSGIGGSAASYGTDLDKTPMPRFQGLAPSTDDLSLPASGSGTVTGDTTPKAHRPTIAQLDSEVVEEEGEADGDSSGLRRYLAAAVAAQDVERDGAGKRRLSRSQSTGRSGPDERSSLLGHKGRKGWFSSLGDQVRETKQAAKKITPRQVVRTCVEEPVKLIPSIILGSLLNVLDGVSYGMILFPANSYFTDFGSLGVSMFFVTCIISQLTYTLGGSIFPGGNGSMMIEAVPFFHILVNIIEAEVGDDGPSIIATTMVSFAFSSILTGLVFYALGAFKLGGLIGYFPRHILVGCIGGVGIFLIETGLEVSRGLKEEGFQYDLATLRLFFDSPHNVILWLLPLLLAVLLRVITHFYHHQLIFPAYFMVIPVIFYIIVAIGGWSFAELREWGWVFDVGSKTQSWWKFYTLFDFGKTNWGAFWAAMPTQLALVFFGILHVPLNVPALGVSLAEDNVNLDRELTAHGISNLAAGVFGTVPNYLCYVNTVLFYRVGGGSRLSGVMLSCATAAIMFVGPTVIGYLPITLVGALIYVLGIDLLLEAVWDTRHKVNRMEYITIWAIAIGMTVWDFVIGLLFGIILACIFFVVQSSRRRPIRVVFDGATAKSTVRRPRSQRAFIQQVGSQTCVMKLQGFLFFGTITVVEDEIRKLLDLALWQHNPIRFLVLDLALVYGLDFSSAEAFVRIQRLLAAKDVLLIMCGAKPSGVVGSSLRAVGLWARHGEMADGAAAAPGGGTAGVEVFAVLNDALEWTENAYLTAFYENQQAQASQEDVGKQKQIDFPKVARPPFSLAESFANSPRRTHLAKAGGDTLPHSFLLPADESEEYDQDGYETPPLDLLSAPQPLPVLIQTFAAYPDSPPPSFYSALVPYFTRRPIAANEILWRQGEPADGLYLVEIGSLRATYAFDDHRELIQETMVAGTVAGDLSCLSRTSRNATVVAEREGVLWMLSEEALERMYKENEGVGREFVRVVLKAVAEEHDVLSAHLIAVLS